MLVPPPRLADGGAVARRSRRSLRAPTFELLPLKNALDQAASCRPARRVSVTASPAKGIEATVALCEQLQAVGFRAVPHLSARMIRDRAHLAELIAWLEGAGVDRAFVVGGDAKEPGDFLDGLSLLREMAEIGHPFAEIGIPCYPQGHAFIADGPLLEALRAKAAFASYMTTQLCFDPARDRVVARGAARGGLRAARPHRRAGRRRAAEAARDQRADRGRRHPSVPRQEHAVRRPAHPIRRLLPAGRASRGTRAASSPTRRAGSSDFHLYTFNAVDVTERWRQGFLEKLAVPVG